MNCRWVNSGMRLKDFHMPDIETDREYLKNRISEYGG
jgi:hypothetical protein